MCVVQSHQRVCSPRGKKGEKKNKKRKAKKQSKGESLLLLTVIVVDGDDYDAAVDDAS